jgi:hypothetical protein
MMLHIFIINHDNVCCYVLCMQDFFLESLLSVGVYSESLQQLLEVLSENHYILFSFQLMPKFLLKHEVHFGIIL